MPESAQLFAAARDRAAGRIATRSGIRSPPALATTEPDAQYRHRRITGPKWQAIVAQVVLRDGGICHICGGPGATSADHFIALADGGPNFPSNLRAAHAHCNYAKSAKRSNRLRVRLPHRSGPSVVPGAIDLPL